MFSKLHKIFDALTDAEREIFQGAMVIFLVSLALNAANAFYKGTTVTPVQGGSYSEGIVGQPIAVNPLLAGSKDPDRDLVALTFARLTDLSEEIKPAPDGQIWTLRLKRNLNWSDGEPLTADDVLFTIHTIQNPDAHAPLFSTWHGVVLERISEREIRFVLKVPYAFFKTNLDELRVAPQHIFGAVPPENLRLSDFNLEPVGSGPYAFGGFEKRRDGFISTLRLVTNERFVGEKPLIPEFRFRFFTNYHDAINAFNHREIDGLGGLTNADLGAVQVTHELHEVRLPRYYAIFTNPNTAAPLKEKEVRQALARATDRAGIISGVLHGHGISVLGPILPGIEGYDQKQERATEHAFFPSEAKAILEKAGWLPGEDGVRTKKVGGNRLRLAFELTVPDLDFLVETAQRVKDDWAHIGVALTLVTLNPADIANETVHTRNYQLLLFGNVMKLNPDIFSFWHSSERFFPGLNLALYENKTVDRLLESLRRDFDPSSRKISIQKLEDIIAEDTPAIFLFSPNYLYVTPKDLGGFDTDLMASPPDRFRGAEHWYLKTARVFK